LAGDKSPGRASLAGVLLGGALGASVAEGLTTAVRTAQTGADIGVTLFAGALGGLLFFVLAGASAWVLSGLFAPEAVKDALRSLRVGLAGAGANALEVVVSLVGLVGAATAAGVIAGRWAFAVMSERFASLVAPLAVVVVLVVGAPVAVLAARSLAGLHRRARQRWVFVRQAGAAHIGLAVAGVVVGVVVAVVLPVSLALAPAAALLGAALGAWRRARPRAVAALASVALFFAAFLGAGAASDAVGSALLYRSPWLGMGIGAVHAAFDADRDGHASVLWGGDCDDDDAKISPSARDVPGNGLDENCSGADAVRYRAPTPPRAPRPAAMPKRMNAVVILIDALRPDRLGFAGYERKLTPKLDAFRATGTWFVDAYTPAPSTRFAMASLFTGTDPIRLPQKGGRGNQFRLLPAANTIAEALTASGYDTVGYTISYVMHHNRGTGQGFRVFETPWPVDDWRKIYGKAAPITTDASLKYLAEREADKPYLLFAHYRCTHDPYIKHPAYDFGNSASDKYDSALAFCDEHVGRLLDGLNAQPDKDRTAVFILSDHGELFGEHGLTNHGNSLFETDVRITLLARVPGATQDTVQAPVSLTDVAPTILDAAGVRPTGRPDGWSLLPLLGDAPPTDAFRARPMPLFTDLKRGSVHYRAAAMIEWPHKLIRDLRQGTVALYDVVADPAEANDLSASNPEALTRLGEKLESWLSTSKLSSVK
jgi:arylsulfatase A-like enzyme